jgi:hypothetical protein
MGLGSEIRDPEKTYYGSPDPGHRIPDTDPQHCVQINLLLNFLFQNENISQMQNRNHTVIEG